MKDKINCKYKEKCSEYKTQCGYCRNNKRSYFEPRKADKPDLGPLRNWYVRIEEPDTNYDLCGERGVITCWAQVMRLSGRRC